MKVLCPLKCSYSFAFFTRTQDPNLLRKFGLMAQLVSASAAGGRSEGGGWRSWLARHVDIVKVTGSSPVPPTILDENIKGSFRRESLHF